MSEGHLGRSQDGGGQGPLSHNRTVVRLPQTRPRKVQCHDVGCATSDITPSPWCQPAEKSAKPKASLITVPWGSRDREVSQAPRSHHVQVGLENSAEAGGGMRGAAEREMEGPGNPRDLWRDAGPPPCVQWEFVPNSTSSSKGKVTPSHTWVTVATPRAHTVARPTHHPRSWQGDCSKM